MRVALRGTRYISKNFGVNRIELRRNGMSRPSKGYTPNFANKQNIKDYLTFYQELECDTGDKIVSLTPFECAIGYTLYAFKIINCPI